MSKSILGSFLSGKKVTKRPVNLKSLDLEIERLENMKNIIPILAFDHHGIGGDPAAVQTMVSSDVNLDSLDVITAASNANR